MTLTRHLLGLLLVVITLGPVVLSAREARARLLPGWTGAPAATATIVVATTTTTVTLELLGLFGQFSLLPIILGLGAASAALWRWGRTGATSDSSPPQPETAPQLPRLGRLLAIITGSVVISEWGWRTAEQLRTGMDSVDTLWYHLPLAARFAQTGDITPLHNFEDQSLTTFFPATSSLWHGLGMELLGTDILSLFMNMGWLAASLLAAWAIGRPYGLAPFTMAAVAVTLALPTFNATQPGGAYNDVVGLFFILAAVAVLVTARQSGDRIGGGELIVVGLAIGLALGTKFQFLIPGGLLAIGAIAIGPRGDRLRRLGHLAPTMFLTGAFWYLRNLVLAGSPLPAMHIAVGPIELRQIEPDLKISQFTEYAGVGRFWGDYFIPGFDAAYGALWWFVLAITVASAGLLFTRNRILAMLTVVALSTLLSFAVTPIGFGFGPNPVLFGIALRYTIISLALGMTLAVILAGQARSPRALVVLAVAMTAIIIAIVVDRSDWQEAREQALDLPIWAPQSLVALALALFAIGAAAWGWRWTRDSPSRRRNSYSAVAVILAVLSIPALVIYRTERYETVSLIPETFAAVNAMSDTRIGLTGTTLQYPLYGEDLSNHVQVIAEQGDYGTAGRFQTCEQFLSLVNSGDYDLVIATPRGFPISDKPSPASRWLEHDAAATLTIAEGPVTTFRITGILDTEDCQES